MADEQIVTSIVANSDFSNLIADVQRVTGSLSRLQQEFAGANRALAGQINAANAMFSETMRKTGQFSTHFVSLTSDVEKFGRNLDSGRLKLRDYFRVYQENVRTSGGLIRDLAKQQVQLQNAVLQPLGRNAQGLMQYNVHIPRGLDLTKNKAALLKQELQIMNKVIQDGGVQLINWGKNTQWAGRQLTVGLTLPLAAFGKAAADAFRQADQELTRLTKVYGDVAGTSAQELGRVRKEVAQTAKELSAAMGVNFSETIGLAADIAATGKTGNDLLASVKETTRLAVLGEVDRQDAMKATLALQSAFKTNTEDLADSINFLNAVENQTSTSLNDLVEAIPKAGPVIKGLGGDVKDLALYLTAMREGGVSASEGANALKSALASLINPTDVAVAKFKSFGIDLLGIVSKNAGSTTDTLFALQAALDKLNPLQKQQAIEQLFGKFQFARLNALFENLGRQGSQTLQVLDLMKASASDLQAVAGRELAQVTESASGRYKRALESLKAELAGVGDQFLDIGTKLINILTKVLDFAQKLPDPIKKLLAFGGAFTAIIGPVIMLTGVLANFFGYIIKGLGHFKALFKGAEGFKLLTPEIMAAKAASSQLADEFYSDALAADTLSAAIKKLNNDLRELQLNASTINANPAAGQVISTIAGNPLMTMGGPRVVAAQHPLLGGRSRAAAHLNPRDPNNPATIFGLTLQPIPVNQRIGRNPQILMNDRLQDIEGLTTIKGSSTGVVASEHARYAALMATLGMQSKQEIEQLKETIGLGGQVSSEFIATFDDILPLTQKLTQNAASQSAAIVAELKAGKINVEQAKAAIIAVNADLERMLGVQVTQYAVSRGRTIDLTKAPLIDQPVVDVQGKPNTRGMFRQGIFGKVMSAVGRATRTRTFGGPYSIETTRPPGLNRGGNIRGYTNGEFVYMTNGETVPGPNVNADVVPAMLTPGEFVLTRGTVQREGSDAVEALHRGEATIVPIQRNSGGSIPNVQYLNQAGPVIALADIMSRRTAIGGSRAVGISSAGHARTSGYNLLHTENALAGGFGYANFAGTSFWNSRAGKEMTRLYGVRGATTVRGSRAQSEVNIHAISSRFTSRFGRGTGRASTPDMLGSDLIALGAMGNIDPTKKYRILPAMSLRGSKEFNEMLPLGKADASMWQKISGSNLTDLAFYLHHTLKLPPNVVNNILEATANRINYSILKNPNKKFTENDFGDIVFDSIENAMQYQINSKTGNWIGLNTGGRVPGFARGGSFAASSYMYRRALAEGNLRPNVLPKSYLLKALGAKFSIRPGGKGYDITSLPVNPDLSMFDGLGLSSQGQKIVYNELVQRVASMKPQTLDRNVKKGFGLHDIDSLWGGTVGFLDPTKLSNPKDRLIIKEFAERTGRMQMGMPPAIVKKLFGGRKLNRGGSAYPRYGYARGVQHKLPGGPILKFLAMLGIPLLGQEVGNRVGGTAGSAISTGSLLASMFMMPGMPGRAPAAIGQKLGFAANESALSPMRQSIFAQGTPVVGRFATSLGTAATSGSKFAQVASKMLIGISRLNVAIGIGTAAVYAGVKAWQNYKRTQELSAAEFGLTADQAEKAGLKYVSYTDKLTKAAEAQKIFRTQLEMAYKSMASAGTPFNLTINEYEKLKQEVKDTMQTQIDLVNAVDDKDLAKIATRLKIQFMAAGMSADEAAKKIYTLLQLSDKASQTINAITTKDFLSITNPQQAATKAIESFNYAAQFENSKDAAFAFNTALQAIDASISDTYSKNEKDAKKKKQNFDEIEQLYIAEKNTLSDINAKVKDQVVLGNDVVDELAKQNPEIKKIIGGQDTILSSWQKIKIAAMGYTGVLSNLGAEQTDLLYKLSNALSQAVEQQNKAGLLKDQYDKLKILKDRYESYTKAAKGQSVQQQINARDAVKALDKQIAKINEAAEARKKALEEETQGQNMALEIQKKRTEYEKAVASGDFSGAAIAQLDLQQLLNEQQTTIATQQIEAARQAAVAPLEERKQALENAQQALADKAALASENLDSLAKQIENQKNKIDAVNKAMFAYRMAQLGVAGDVQTAGAGLVDAFKKSGVKVDEYTKKYVGSQLVTVKLTPQEILDKIFATDKSGLSIETILAQKDIIINGTRVIINGKQLDTGGLGTKESPYDLGKGSAIKIERQTSKTTVITPITDSQLQNPDNSTLKGIAKVAKEEGYLPGQYISLTDSKGNSYRFLINKDATVQKAALGKYIRGYNNGTTDGPVEGPGTGTSDSILAKLSNGEFVTKSSSVSDIGVDNMHLINTLGSQGVLKAAEKIVNGHARGGEVGSTKDSGFKTGYDSAKDYFKKLGDLSVNFATDKFNLQDSEKLELDDIAKKLEASGVKEFLVKGYADRRGSKTYNLQLSLRRAEAVANYLENILPNIRFVPMALGEENSSSSASAMSKKRRVSVELPQKFGGPTIEKDTVVFGGSGASGDWGGGGWNKPMFFMARGGLIPGFKDGGMPDMLSSINKNNFNPSNKNNDSSDSWVDKSILSAISLAALAGGAAKLFKSIKKTGFSTHSAGPNVKYFSYLEKGNPKAILRATFDGEKWIANMFAKDPNAKIPSGVTSELANRAGKLGNIVWDTNSQSPALRKFIQKNPNTGIKQVGSTHNYTQPDLWEGIRKEYTNTRRIRGAGLGGVGGGIGLFNNLNMARGGYIKGFYKGGMPSPFAMGMEWFGNTITNATRSAAKFMTGIDPINIFGPKTAEDWFSTATFFAPALKLGKIFKFGKGIKSMPPAAKAAEKIPFYGKHNIKKYSIPMEGEALRTNTAIKKLWSKISPTGVEFPKLVRTKLPQGVAGRYYGPEIEDIKGGTLQLPGLLQGLTANTATHEFLHHLDYVKTHASFRSFIDKYEKTNPEYIKELKDAFYAVEKIRPGLGYKKIEEMMSKLPDTELKSYFAGLKEGYATDTTFLLNKKFGGIGNPYIYDSGYYGSLREYLSSYRGITTPQYKLHPNMLQGILDKSPNMPETLRANYLKAIEFMKAENITPDLPVKDPAKYSDILAKALATKLKLNYGGYINPSYRPDMKIPSFETGIKYLYGDTIAQLHQKEAVLPADMNPFNPTATNPIGGGTYYIQPTINAAPGMDENMITDLAVQKVMNQLKDIDRRAGGNINMSNRYVKAGGIR